MSDIFYQHKLCSAHFFVLEMLDLLPESVESPEQHDRRLTSKQVLEDTSLLSIIKLSVSPSFPAILTQFPGPKCACGTYGRDKICVCLVEFHFTLHPQCLVFLSTSNDTLQCIQSVFSSWKQLITDITDGLRTIL